MTERAVQWTEHEKVARADIHSSTRRAAPTRSPTSALVTHSLRCSKLAYQCAAALAATCNHVRVAPVDATPEPFANPLPHSSRRFLILVLQTGLDGALPSIALDWLRRGKAPQFAAAAVCGVGAREVRAVPNIRTLELWLCSSGTPIVVPALQALDESDGNLSPWCREVTRVLELSE